MSKPKTPLLSMDSLITDDSAKAVNITKAIHKAKASAVDLQREYQVIACSAIVHLGTFWDISVIRNLFDSMPDSLNVNSMKEFMNKYAPVKYDEDGQVFVDKNRSVSLGEAMENAWYKAKPQAPYKPFDFTAELDKLLKRAGKKLETPKAGDVVTQAQIEAVRETFYKIKPKAEDKVNVDPLTVDLDEVA